MFKGDYNFFDYKHNIAGYTGQDFGSIAQKLYLIISLVLLVILLIGFRKAKRETVIKIIRIVSIFIIILYIVKNVWETIYDIKFTGKINWYLLPFDTCGFVMLAGILSGFCKGRIKEYADSWLVTGCIIGGIANMLFLNAFKFYPFLSFGAFYSMLWHFLMVFLGLLLVVTNHIEINIKTILKGFIFHLIVSIFVIPINYIFGYDFMLYKDLGGVPIFENIATKFTNMQLGFINPIMMIVLYFISFSIVVLIAMGIKKIISKLKGL